MADYTYRYYKAKQIPEHIQYAIYDLDQQYFDDCIDIKWKNTDWVVCYHKGEMIAYGGIHWKNEEEGFLCRSAVEYEHWGKGIQKQLIKRRLKAARNHNIINITTYTSPENYASINSLISCGFKIYKPKRRDAGKEMLYWKKINE